MSKTQKQRDEVSWRQRRFRQILAHCQAPFLLEATMGCIYEYE